MIRLRLFRSLRTKLLLASLFIEAVMLTILVGNSMRLIEEHLAHQAENRIQAIEIAYKTALAGPLAARDYATLRDILEGWKQAEDIRYIIVTDRAGRQLASLGWPHDQPPPAPTTVRAGGETIHVAFPIAYFGTSYGSVHYGLSAEFLSQARSALFDQSVTIAMIALFLTFLLLMATGYWLTRDFASLAQASRQIAAGDFAVEVRLHGDDEVADLGHSFNAMAVAVRSRIAALHESEQRFRAIADYTHDWENWFGPDGRLRWVNPAVERMTGYTVRECLAMEDFPLPLVSPEDHDALRAQQRRALAGQSGQDVELRIRCRDGHLLWAAMVWHPIFADDGTSLGYRSSLRDVTAQREAREELAYAASHDPLTGLQNRRAFETELRRRIEAQGEGAASLIVFYIDLDQFKLINDTCGHVAGDALLKQLAEVLQSNCAFGFLARLGGDEFGMILSGCDLDTAAGNAQRIIDEIRSIPFLWDRKSFRLGASIGVAQYTPQIDTVTSLLMAADTACYAAKERGRNRAQVYLPEDRYFQERQAEYLSLTQISEALSRGRLVVYGQRIAALDNGLDDYVEVLVRMTGSDGRLIGPDRFIPAAERYGMMPLIDHWVLEAACRQIAAWRGQGIAAPKLAINLSGTTLAEPGLADFIRQTFRTYEVTPSQIAFEITESCAIAQLDQALAFIACCADIGCDLALDDFGSGLSSFAYLKRFRVQTLKIDGMFVQHADQDADDRAVIDSMVRLAKLRGLRTVAEFVCNDAVLDTVRQLGVDYAQGFAVHKPAPLAELL